METLPPPGPAIDRAVPSRPPPLRNAAASRTAEGLALLAIAVLVQSVPALNLLGLLVGAAGAILMILGARGFGDRHEMLVWAAVVLFVVAEGITFALVASFGAAITLQANASGPAAASAVLADFNALLEGGMAVGAIIGLSSLLIAIALEDRVGQTLLAAGVVATALISVYLYAFILEPFIRTTILQAYASTPVNTNAILNADAQLRTLTAPLALDLIPPVLFAGAYLWAAHRISCRVIPAPAPPEAHTSRAVLAAIVGVVMVASAAAVGGVATGVFTTTPPPPLVWTMVANFTGTTTGRTANFTVTATTSTVNESLFGYGPVQFEYSVYASGTNAFMGSGGMGGGGGGPMAGGGSGPGSGTYYIVVTNVTGVASWQITVWQWS